jgi:hypothetical protein
VTERLVVPTKSGNADGGKGPWFRNNVTSEKGMEIGHLPAVVESVHAAIHTGMEATGICKKHKVQSTGTRYPNQYLYEQLGLIDIRKRTHNLPWVKA